MLLEKSGGIVVYLSVEYSYFLIVMIIEKNILKFHFCEILCFTNGIFAHRNRLSQTDAQYMES